MAKATRQAFAESLVKLAGNHQEIVVLDADLAKSTKTELFAKKHPDRFFEMGIAEANMIGTAAGLALSGKLPFLCSFGCFLTGRYDTIRMSVAYSQANVRLVVTHAGLGIGDDGHSQMGLEDIALMRALPTMGVFQPMDARETELVMEYLVNDWKGPAYLRLTRQNVPDLYPEGRVFQPCKLMEIVKVDVGRPGVVCFATGAAVAEAVAAAGALLPSGIAMSVWNVHSLKPFDEEGMLAAIKGARLVISVEDHSVIGGLGSAVAEALARHGSHPPLIRLGVQDTFGQSGEPVELYDMYGLSAAAIEKRIKSHLISTGK